MDVFWIYLHCRVYKTVSMNKTRYWFTEGLSKAQNLYYATNFSTMILFLQDLTSLQAVHLGAGFDGDNPHLNTSDFAQQLCKRHFLFTGVKVTLYFLLDLNFSHFAIKSRVQFQGFGFFRNICRHPQPNFCCPFQFFKIFVYYPKVLGWSFFCFFCTFSIEGGGKGWTYSKSFGVVFR